jgi:DNA gyrase subunit A
MQTTFGVNLLGLINNRPQTLSLLELLTHFLEFRREVVRRRAAYDLRQAEDRAHVLEGFARALEHLDEVIALIRQSANPAAARVALVERFEFTDRQAQAILELRLQRLTAMERQRILEDLEGVRALIAELKELLASEEKVTDKIVEELGELREKYADSRRTELGPGVEDFTAEDLIPEEDVVVTISHLGYAKRSPTTLYRAQRRGGKGKTGMGTRDEDFVTTLFVASTHSYVLFFTNRGRVHWLKVHGLPEVGRTGRGKPLVNLLELAPEERVSAILPVRSFDEGGFVVLATERGVIKKTELVAFANPRRGGIIAINVLDGDEVIGAARTNGSEQLLIATRGGKAIRFGDAQVRPMGRAAAGVRAIQTRRDDRAVGMEVLRPGATILTVTERGYGKRSPLGDYREQSRGGQGIFTVKVTSKNGPVVGIQQVSDEDELMLITDAGKLLRLRVSSIPTMGRNTQGVRLMDMGLDERIVAVARLAEPEDDRNGPPAEEGAPSH